MSLNQDPTSTFEFEHAAQLPTTLEDSIPLFKTTPDDRNDDENKALISLLQTVPYLNSLAKTAEKPQDFLLNLTKLFQHEVYSKGRAIGHHGELCRKFWILLKGEIKTYIPRQFEGQEEASKNDTSAANHHDTSGVNTQLRSPHGPSRKCSLSILDAPIQIPEKHSVVKHIEKQSTIDLESPHHNRSSFGTSFFVDDRKSILKPSTKQVIIEFADHLKDAIKEEDHSDHTPHHNHLSVANSPRIIKPAKLTMSNVVLGAQEVEIFRKFNKPKKYFKNDVFLFHPDLILTSGACFNDLDINAYAPLPASLIAAEDAHLITIPMKQYMVELRDLNKALSENLVYLENLFPDVPERLLLNLAYSMQKKTFHKGEFVFQEGSKCSNLYFMLTGEIQLIKNLANEVETDVEQQPQSPKNNLKQQHNVPILILSEGQMFAEESVLHVKRHLFTAKTKTLEATVYVILNMGIVNLGNRDATFSSLMTNKAKSNLKTKLDRVTETIKEIEITQHVFEAPTDEEKNNQDYIKGALDYYTLSLFQQRSPKERVTALHIRAGGRESPYKLSETQSKELQKLADIKTKTVRNLTKIDPRFEIEHTSPTFKLKRIEEDRLISERASKKIVYSNINTIKPLSIWNQSLEGSWYLKKVKALKTVKKTKDPLPTFNRPPLDETSGLLKNNKLPVPTSPYFLESPGLVGDTSTLPEKDQYIRKALKSHIMMVDSPSSYPSSVRVETLNTEAQDDVSRRFNTEIVDRTLRKEVDDVIHAKLNDNKKEGYKLLHDNTKRTKIKRGFVNVKLEKIVQGPHKKESEPASPKMKTDIKGWEGATEVNPDDPEDLLGVYMLNSARSKGGEKTKNPITSHRKIKDKKSVAVFTEPNEENDDTPNTRDEKKHEKGKSLSIKPATSNFSLNQTGGGVHFPEVSSSQSQQIESKLNHLPELKVKSGGGKLRKIERKGPRVLSNNLSNLSISAKSGIMSKGI